MTACRVLSMMAWLIDFKGNNSLLAAVHGKRVNVFLNYEIVLAFL